jgi:hypothetical protein
MRKSIRYYFFVCLGTFFLIAGRASAQTVLFTDFGPGQSFDMSASQGILKTSAVVPFSLAAQGVGSAFKITASSLTGRFYLTQIDLAVGGTEAFTVQLTEDADGIPGTVLESWVVAGPTLPVTTVVDALSLQLHANRQYWVVLQPSTVDPNENDVWYEADSAPYPSALDDFYYKNSGAIENFPWQIVQGSSLAFDVKGMPINFGFPPIGVVPGQILRLIAGPVTPVPGSPVEANLSFVDLSGNVIGPSSTFTINPGETVALDFHPDAYTQVPGQRLEIIPVITQSPNPNAAPPGSIQASVQVIDSLLGFATVLSPASQWPPDPNAPALVTQDLAGGQTMRLNVVAFPPNPCDATLSFADNNGNPLGQSQQVTLPPGAGASFDLNADTLGLKLGQHIDVQPMVTATAPVGAAVAPNSACQISVEVFDRITGRTTTYQNAVAQLPAVQ